MLACSCFYKHQIGLIARNKCLTIMALNKLVGFYLPARPLPCGQRKLIIGLSEARLSNRETARHAGVTNKTAEIIVEQKRDMEEHIRYYCKGTFYSDL